MQLWVAAGGLDQPHWKQWTQAISLWMRDSSSSAVVYLELPQVQLAQYQCLTVPLQPPPTPLHKAPIVADGWLHDPAEKRSWSLEKSSSPQLAKLSKRIFSGGAEYFDQVFGEFSLSAWHESTQTLFIANDALGISSVYYWQSASNVLLASNHLPVLLLSQLVPFELNVETLLSVPFIDYSTNARGMGEHSTFFQEVQRLPAASLLRWTPVQTELSKYWNLGGVEQLDAKSARDEVVALVRGTIQDAVSDRTEVGGALFQLSGGLDSATTLCAAVEAGHTPTAVHMGLADRALTSRGDEEAAVRIMRKLGIPGLILYADNLLDLSGQLENGRRHLRYLDGPQPQAYPLMDEALDAIALDTQASYIVTGHGGDELLGGSRLAVESLFRQRRFRQGVQALSHVADSNGPSTLSLGVCFILAQFWPRVDNYLFELVDRWDQPASKLPNYVTQKHCDVHQDLRCIGTSAQVNPWETRRMLKVLMPRPRLIDRHLGCLQESHPFLDRRVIELVLSLPPEWIVDLSTSNRSFYRRTRTLTREAFEDIIPGFIRERYTKTTYGHLTVAMMQRNRRFFLETMVSSGERLRTAELGLIDQARFRNQLLALIIRAEDLSSTLDPLAAYARYVIELELWLRAVAAGRERLLDDCRPRFPRSLESFAAIRRV
jgi:asparagine synthase (glutamine-hydrolysing)